MGSLTWDHRFLLASLLTLILGMTGIGWWVADQIQAGVIHQTAAYTALYVSSMVEPDLQELAETSSLSAEATHSLDRILATTGLGQHITAVKVWVPNGTVVYATQASLIGRQFPIDPNLKRALHGWVASEISTLNRPENSLDTDRGKRRLETYSPVRRTGTDQIVAAVEFYQTAASLDQNIEVAQRNSWLVVFGVTVLMYLLLAGFVRRAGLTLRKQGTELKNRVAELEDVLEQNRALHERVRKAAEGSTARNEKVLRRISAELHDGPAQDLGFALLRLDRWKGFDDEEFSTVKASLGRALGEIRSLSAGMGLPGLENLDLLETLRKAIRAHERRTGTSVTQNWGTLPSSAPLSLKITLYRIVQEALTNAWRHAGAVDQTVEARIVNGSLALSISDGGPGFDVGVDSEEHLGLLGMRERAESLGGTFRIVRLESRGTRIEVNLPWGAEP